MSGAAHPMEFEGYNGDPSMMLAMMYGGPFMSEYAYGGVPMYNVGGWRAGSFEDQMKQGNTPEYMKVRTTEGRTPEQKKQIAKIAFDAGTAGLTMLGNAITEPRTDLSQMTSADQVFASSVAQQGMGQAANFPGQDVGFGAGRGTPVQFTGFNARHGGNMKYAEGGTYDLTEAEIAQIMKMGGTIEYI